MYILFISKSACIRSLLWLVDNVLATLVQPWLVPSPLDPLCCVRPKFLWLKNIVHMRNYIHTNNTSSCLRMHFLHLCMRARAGAHALLIDIITHIPKDLLYIYAAFMHVCVWACVVQMGTCCMHNLRVPKILASIPKATTRLVLSRQGANK